jgi:hypothetical protein
VLSGMGSLHTLALGLRLPYVTSSQLLRVVGAPCPLLRRLRLSEACCLAQALAGTDTPLMFPQLEALEVIRLTAPEGWESRRVR